MQEKQLSFVSINRIKNFQHTKKDIFSDKKVFLCEKFNLITDRRGLFHMNKMEFIRYI